MHDSPFRRQAEGIERSLRGYLPTDPEVPIQRVTDYRWRLKQAETERRQETVAAAALFCGAPVHCVRSVGYDIAWPWPGNLAL